MILDPRLPVMCDGCKCEIEIDMTALASGAYDARDARGQIKREGWLVAGNDEHYCEDCRKDHEPAK
jgi:hypothetical protein